MKKIILLCTILVANSAEPSWQAGEGTFIKIDYLKNHTEHIITCATWSYKEWGHHRPGETLETFIESRKQYLNDTTLPLTLIAFDNDTPVGMCSLAITRGLLPDLTPWLAALYVTRDHRNKKIGTLLEAEISKKALAMGFEKIYLFTSDLTIIPWYEKLGWSIKGAEWLRDHTVTVMEKELSKI
jgi:GNAT superfamily N-acetyltransferase